jgi:methylthioribose-1-phosphate isomerase
LIGAAAAYGMALALAGDSSDAALDRSLEAFSATRPTAVNLRWALDRIAAAVRPLAPEARARAAFAEAERIVDEDVATNAAIGAHGLGLIRAARDKKADAAAPVNILTHCNAGWLATVDWGTALAPIYRAFDEGVSVHVWVDETRPRNQGALTAWELASHGVPHSVVVDNAGGHLMQRGLVDLCIVGTDRTTRQGDVCNKIGTYLKALAARDNGVPFYVALPGPTIDWSIGCGADIPIEERAPEEITKVTGRTARGATESVDVFPEGTRAANYAFDVTPARLVTELITERGVCAASEAGLLSLYPERSNG